MFSLMIDQPLKHPLWEHLLPKGSLREQAAFLYCTASRVGQNTSFEVVDTAFLAADNFTAQHSDYLELSDETRIALIKRAHELTASLVELHSHPGPWPAAFSPADRRGLRETVPHMRWRLSGRPYLAIVVAPSGFDALVWPANSLVPEPLGRIQVGDELLAPTNASLEGWND